MKSIFHTSVAGTIRKYTMLQRDDRVLVAVSGGADSVCLALILKDLGYQTGIAHLNHGLRGGDSDADEAFSKALADRLDVPYFSKKIELPAGNVEAAGREKRHAFLREVADRHEFTKIGLAHTR